MKFFSKTALSIIIVLCACILTSCETDDSGIIENYDYTTFEGLIYKKTISLTGVLEAAMEDYHISEDMIGDYINDISLLKLLNRSYEASAIKYKTVAPDGSPITASGVVYYPKVGRPKGVVEISPVNQSKGTCASQQCEMAEVLPAMVAGYICIVPDLIGCGETEYYPIEYMQHDNIAIISADMRKAAEEYLYTHHRHKMSRESILFGYSLGGSGILALAREYQLNPSRKVKVNHIFAGGGAYEPKIVFEELLKAGKADYAIIPNILWSLNFYDKLNLDFTQLFKGDLLNNYTSWCQGYIPIAELTGMLGTDLTTYLTDYALNSLDETSGSADIIRVIESKSLHFDWVPKAKVHLCHAIDDTYVPTALGDRMYQQLKSAGANVEYKYYDAHHVYAGLYMAIDFAEFLLKN